jgi:flagellar hook-length control protein FliK
VPDGPVPAAPAVAETIGKSALPVLSAAEATGGSAQPPSVPVFVQPRAELDTTADAGIVPGSARPETLAVEGPAMGVIAALATGEKPARGPALPEPAIPAVPVEMVIAPALPKGSADLVALMQTKGSEAAAKPAMTGSPISEKGAVAGEIAKVQFADWINEFAFQQGAVHRSGDLVGSLDRALAALPTPHAGQDALRPTPLQMLPIEIGMQAMRGVKTFQIRLDPAELGRVEVKLEIREDGEVKANLVVDRVETLAMLKRDANTLQQAFEQAGLRQSADGLSFQLRGEQQGRDGQRQPPAQNQPGWSAEADETGLARPNDIVMRRVMIPNSSLDLVI